MDEAPKHPLRSATLVIYQRIEGASGPAFFGKIEPFATHPIYFHGQTVGAVEDQARAWCGEQADKFEAQWQAAWAVRHKSALTKARAAKLAKEMGLSHET